MDHIAGFKAEFAALERLVENVGDTMSDQMRIQLEALKKAAEKLITAFIEYDDMLNSLTRSLS